MRRGRHNRLGSSRSAVAVYFRTDLVGTLARVDRRRRAVLMSGADVGASGRSTGPDWGQTVSPPPNGRGVSAAAAGR